jgi:endonuclease G
VHFSLVLSAERRVAIVAAHNVDPDRLKRGFRNPEWRLDERAGAAQLGPEAYEGNAWDRGHLAKREDVCWGSLAEARDANASTFFYPNAAPQHVNFNRDEWKLLEDWILDRVAIRLDRRMSVFTGPVLSPDDRRLSEGDPKLRAAFRGVRADVLIPSAYWKICVVRDAAAAGDDLSVTAFAMKQNEHWKDQRGAKLLDLRVHQVTVETIERWTDLDFGALRDADELRWDRTLRRAAGELTFPAIAGPEDIVVSGAERRAARARAFPRAGRPGPERAGAPRRACCGAGFDARSAVAALSRDVERLTDAVLALEARTDEGEEPAADEEAPRARAAGRARRITYAPRRVEPATDEEQALLDLAPAASRDRLLRFLRSERVVREPAGGSLRGMKRIVGGQPISAAEFPSCCCLGASGPSWFCSGVLVHPRLVLTAAHCADEEIARVLVGGSRIPPAEDGALVAAERVHVHPHYVSRGRIRNDLAIVELREDAAATPVPLATAKELAAAESVDLVGFGYSDPERPVGFGRKRHVNVLIGVLEEEGGAGEQLEQRFGFDSRLEFVAGRKGLGRDTCNGDSGGPAYVDVAGEIKLAGITSRATDEGVAACGDGGVYTRPDRYLDWIGTVAREAGVTFPS